MTYAMLRVKNESRWIARVIGSVLPVCHKVFVLDDHSSDGTPEICEGLGCTVFRSPFQETVDETRDKNFLLHNIFDAGVMEGDWVLCVDGDELLNPADLDVFAGLLSNTSRIYNFKIEYLWDREDQLRVDRIYSNFYRPSLFPVTSHNLIFKATTSGGNIHCSNVPANVAGVQTKAKVRLIHFGYLHKEDRIRKYNFYNTIDPDNAWEDHYRHVVAGDLPEVPATSTLKWAGPLQLKPSPFQI